MTYECYACMGALDGVATQLPLSTYNNMNETVINANNLNRDKYDSVPIPIGDDSGGGGYIS